MILESKERLAKSLYYVTGYTIRNVIRTEMECVSFAVRNASLTIIRVKLSYLNQLSI
jgi:hypothetical protein